MDSVDLLLKATKASNPILTGVVRGVQGSIADVNFSQGAAGCYIPDNLIDLISVGSSIVAVSPDNTKQPVIIAVYGKIRKPQKFFAGVNVAPGVPSTFKTIDVILPTTTTIIELSVTAEFPCIAKVSGGFTVVSTYGVGAGLLAGSTELCPYQYGDGTSNIHVTSSRRMGRGETVVFSLIAGIAGVVGATANIYSEGIEVELLPDG